MRKLLGVIGAVTVVASVAYVAQPTGHIPPYDANLVRLAETELQGWCAGSAFWASQGAGDAGLAAECRASFAADFSSESSMPAAEDAFCRAVQVAGYPGEIAECLTILRTQQLWPTYDGGLTREWNRAHRYPLETGLVPDVPDDSRTGGRETITHEGPVRGATPSPTPTPEESETPTASPSEGEG